MALQVIPSADSHKRLYFLSLSHINHTVIGFDIDIRRILYNLVVVRRRT